MKTINDEVIRLQRLDGSIHIYVKPRNNRPLNEIQSRLRRRSLIYNCLVSQFNKEMDFTLCLSKGTIIINDFR